MTLWVVRHDVDVYRVHEPDGTQLGTDQAERPSRRDIAEVLASEFGGASLWAENPQRGYMMDVTTSGIVFRDLTIDGETVPWGP